jgi:hypothetical protein
MWGKRSSKECATERDAVGPSPSSSSYLALKMNPPEAFPPGDGGSGLLETLPTSATVDGRSRGREV